MSERMIGLTAQEIQRIEAILMDRDKDEALRFLKEVIKKRVRVTQGHPCGSKPA